MDIWGSLLRDDEGLGTGICIEELSARLWSSMQWANHEATMKNILRFDYVCAQYTLNGHDQHYLEEGLKNPYPGSQGHIFKPHLIFV